MNEQQRADIKRMELLIAFLRIITVATVGAYLGWEFWGVIHG